MDAANIQRTLAEARRLRVQLTALLSELQEVRAVTAELIARGKARRIARSGFTIKSLARAQSGCLIARPAAVQKMPDTAPPVRVYTCFVDGVIHSIAFPHNGLTGVPLTMEANTRFNAWLEIIAPGARSAGRVTGIRFADLEE